MEICDSPAPDETMAPVPPAEVPQAPAVLDPPVTPTAPVAAAAATPAAALASCNASPRLALAAPPALVSSPGALLAASLVRSRATYFERLSSGSRASTSSASAQQDGLTHAPSSQTCPPTPRHSTTLAAQPLHPLALHPLSGSGRTAGGCAIAAAWRDYEQQQQQTTQQTQAPQRHVDSDSGVDSDDDSVDTFFNKPSYTCYGAAVELSPASSYGGAPHAAQSPPPPQGTHATSHNYATDLDAAAAEQQSTSSTGAPLLPAATTTITGGDGASAPAAAPSDLPAVTRDARPAGGSTGYVRSMSAHFTRVSGGTGSFGRSSSGMDGLFDDLVTHVGALLASHPDVEAQMGMVQGLSDRLLDLHALCGTLGRKEDEVEHLRGVLGELTTTRAEAIRLKVQMAESLNGLQQEYYRVLRSAQMAQGTCKLHSVRAAATRKQLLEAQGDLVRYKRAVASLRDRNRRLRIENEDMASRLLVLEQGRGGSDGHRSASYMTLLQSQTPVLY